MRQFFNLLYQSSPLSTWLALIIHCSITWSHSNWCSCLVLMMLTTSPMTLWLEWNEKEPMPPKEPWIRDSLGTIAKTRRVRGWEWFYLRFKDSLVSSGSNCPPMVSCPSWVNAHWVIWSHRSDGTNVDRIIHQTQSQRFKGTQVTYRTARNKRQVPNSRQFRIEGRVSMGFSYTIRQG